MGSHSQLQGQLGSDDINCVNKINAYFFFLCKYQLVGKVEQPHGVFNSCLPCHGLMKIPYLKCQFAFQGKALFGTNEAFP